MLRGSSNTARRHEPAWRRASWRRCWRYVAFAILFVSAAVQNSLQTGAWSALPGKAQSIKHKAALCAGLGWTSTLVMVVATPVLGVALVQVMVVSGEMITAVVIDVCISRKKVFSCLTLAALCIVLSGVALSLFASEEAPSSSSDRLSLPTLLLYALVSFGCGSCLVLNALGNGHTRRYLGASNASACSALAASFGNTVFWLAAELSNSTHYRPDFSPTTTYLWLVVGGCSALMVFVITFVPERIGFAMTFCLIVAGKISGGLVVDATGISGKPRPLTFLRVGGVALVFLGAILLKVPQHSSPKSPAAYSPVQSKILEAPTIIGSSEQTEEPMPSVEEPNVSGDDAVHQRSEREP